MLVVSYELFVEFEALRAGPGHLVFRRGILVTGIVRAGL